VRGDLDGTTLTSFLSLHRRERRQRGEALIMTRDEKDFRIKANSA